MLRIRSLLAPAAALAVALLLSACAGAGGSAELIADESPVPDGMPVMYEFFTTT